MKAAIAKMTCPHERFNGAVKVGRVVDKDPIEFVVDLTVHCEDCKTPFAFDIELPKNAKGLALTEDRLQLRVRLKE